jgi:hypothetical protein
MPLSVLVPGTGTGTHTGTKDPLQPLTEERGGES